LEHIAEKRNIEISEKEKTKKQIAKRLAADISASGLERLFGKLPIATLEKLSESVPTEEGEKKPKARSVLAKRLKEHVDSEGAKKFFDEQDNAVLKELLLKMGEEPNKTKLSDQVLAYADFIGLDACFSSFSSETLAAIVDSCGLTVEGGGAQHMIDSLITQTDYKAPKKAKKAAPKASETKPAAIKKGISKIDLKSWYSHAELQEWCEKNIPEFKEKIKSRKTMVELANLIDRHFNGLGLPEKKKKKAKTGAKRKASEGKQASPAKKKAKKE